VRKDRSRESGSPGPSGEETDGIGGAGDPQARSGTAAALKLWVVLSRAFYAIEEHVRSDVARHGLTTAEFGALEALYHKGPMLVGEVKRKILVSSGGITYVIDRLVSKGLVERQECPEDRRASYAALTERGREVIARIFPEHAKRLEHALSGLGEQEKENGIELLRRLGLEAERLGKCASAAAVAEARVTK
jgi:MarR family transcriptional regulator, 2-MHQ and catechol-resistance regulon repressor